MTTARTWRCPRDHTCPAPASHDQWQGYDRGCRSGAARADYSRYRKHGRAGIRASLYADSTGTARRLQALASIGWDATTLAARLGTNKSALQQLRRAFSPRVRTATAARVAALYTELADHAGPSPQARQHARAVGWADPFAWDDDTIDDPAAQPWQAESVDTTPDWAAVDAVAHRRIPFTDLRPVDQRHAVARVRAELEPHVEHERIRVAIAARLNASHEQVSAVVEQIARLRRRERERDKEGVA